jgi:hypothetical protein
MISILTENNRRSDISFSPDGRIDISARVAKLLDIRQGDTLDIMCDKAEYYLYVRNRSPQFGRFEATCYRSNKKGRHFRAYSQRLCKAVLSACNTATKLCIGVGEIRHISGQDYLTIITKKRLNPE